MSKQIKIKGRIIGFKLENDKLYLIFRTLIVQQGDKNYIKAYNGYFYFNINEESNTCKILNNPLDLSCEKVGKRYIDFYIHITRTIPIVSKKNTAILILEKVNQQWIFKEIKIVLGDM